MQLLLEVQSRGSDIKLPPDRCLSVSADYGFELTLWDFNKHAERVSTVLFPFNKSTLSQYFFFHSEINGLMEITKKTLFSSQS